MFGAEWVSGEGQRRVLWRATARAGLTWVVGAIVVHREQSRGGEEGKRRGVAGRWLSVLRSTWVRDELGALESDRTESRGTSLELRLGIP